MDDGDTHGSSDTGPPKRSGRRPEWLRVRLPGGVEYGELKRLVRRLGLHTVCDEAACPNVGECWGRRSMTLMILGDRCTRSCRFCGVSPHALRPPDPAEPARIAEALAQLGLRHTVLTSVTRDDLPDGGAAHWAATLRRVRQSCPELTVEALVPDFGGDLAAVDVVLEARPHVFAHNLETVRRLTPEVRSHASYDRSLEVLAHASSRGVVTKSGLMAGLGETVDELREALRDLRRVGAQLATLGQYLRPTREHLPVAEYVESSTFEELARYGVELGFAHVAAGPLVRSSYHADIGLSCLIGGE
ncbi:MAG: lipoyl synthase [bacterium]